MIVLLAVTRFNKSKRFPFGATRSKIFLSTFIAMIMNSEFNYVGLKHAKKWKDNLV